MGLAQVKILENPGADLASDRNLGHQGPFSREIDNQRSMIPGNYTLCAGPMKRTLTEFPGIS